MDLNAVNPEGYVAIDRVSGGAVKLVDRMEFSFNNFKVQIVGINSMKGFKEFINLCTKTKKCPEGYRFDKKLGVCVPIGHKGYYPFYAGRKVVEMVMVMVIKMGM